MGREKMRCNASILLCADAESIAHSQLLGLDDVNLEGLSWLQCTSSAEEARNIAKDRNGVEEAWIASSDDISALNLAAALHKDRSDLAIRLIAFSPSGSFMSNAKAVGACEVLTETTFPRRFSDACITDGKALAVPSTDTIDSKTNIAERHDPDRAKGMLIPVLSGSGGSGRSALSAMIATLLVERGYSVMVVDLDLQFGDMHRLLGYETPVSMNDILSDSSAIEAIRPKDSTDDVRVARPSVIAAPYRLEQADLINEHVCEVVDLCMSLYDVVVVNTSSSWGDHHAMLLEKSSNPIFLIDQRSSSVLSCKHALDLCTRMGIATSSFLFALNRCSRDAMFTGMDIAMALQGVHVVEIKDGGREVEELLGSGMAGELCSSKNEALKGVHALLDEISGPKHAARRRRSSFKG